MTRRQQEFIRAQVAIAAGVFQKGGYMTTICDKNVQGGEEIPIPVQSTELKPVQS